MNRKAARENSFILLFESACKTDETAEEIFEKAISIVDAIESILSSTINEIEYFDNAYLHLKGVVDNLAELDNFDGDPFEDMKNNRTLITLGDGDANDGSGYPGDGGGMGGSNPYDL